MTKTTSKVLSALFVTENVYLGNLPKKSILAKLNNTSWATSQMTTRVRKNVVARLDSDFARKRELLDYVAIERERHANNKARVVNITASDMQVICGTVAKSRTRRKKQSQTIRDLLLSNYSIDCHSIDEVRKLTQY